MRVKAFAKINLFLQVTGKRADGYHSLHTLFQQIGLHDKLEFKKTRNKEIKLVCAHPAVPLDESNLVIKAAHLLRQAAEKAGKQVTGLKIYLTKNIPVGAGLGGGSSDAAATLCALNKLWELGFSLKKLERMAEHLGSDVPFFLQGGIAEAYGRGEKLIPIGNIPAFRVIVVKPSFSISTAWAYQHLVLKNLTKKPKNSNIIHYYLKKRDFSHLSKLLFNDLEEVCIRRYSFILTLKRRLLDAGAEIALMSGSGSAVFALVSTRLAEARIKEVFGQEKDVWMWSGMTSAASRYIKEDGEHHGNYSG